MLSAITSAVKDMKGDPGDIVIPVYLGGTMLDEVIVTAQQRANLKKRGKINMAFIQYLKFDEKTFPCRIPMTSDISDVESDSIGEIEAGTTQRDVVRTGVVAIAVSLSVFPSWLKDADGIFQDTVRLQ